MNIFFFFFFEIYFEFTYKVLHSAEQDWHLQIKGSWH